MIDPTETPLYIEFKEKLEFDPLRIDKEIAELPVLIMHASELAAKSERVSQETKSALDVTEAQVQLTTRASAAAQGNKLTEKWCEAMVVASDEVCEAVMTRHEAAYAASIWKALVNALNKKSDAMETYSKLLLAGFITPDAVLKERREKMNTARKERDK